MRAKLLKCSFYYFKVFGMATMTFHESPEENNVYHRCWFVYSIAGTIYNLCLLTGLTVSNYFSLSYLFNYQAPSVSMFENIFDVMVDILAVLAFILILLTFSIKQNIIVEIANNITRIRESTRILRTEFDCEMAIFSEVALIILIIGVIWFIKVITMCMRSSECILANSSIYFTDLSITSIMLQYSFILIFLKKIFNSMNDDLFKAFQDLTSLPIEKRRYLKLSNLSQLQHLYVQLFEVSQDISDFYSRPMLMCVANVFYACISSSYYIARPITLGEQWLPFKTTLHIVCYGTLHMALLIILTKSVTDTVAEVIVN